jgi:hypothetical protein
MRGHPQRRMTPLIAILLLVSIIRCVPPTLCPTDEQLLAAVKGRDYDMVQAISNQEARDNPNEITFVHSERIKSVTDAICGEALPGDLPTITCKYTVRYWSRNTYQVAKLVKKADGWQITDALSVTRERP